jgi:hypothetical protein
MAPVSTDAGLVFYFRFVLSFIIYRIQRPFSSFLPPIWARVGIVDFLKDLCFLVIMLSSPAPCTFSQSFRAQFRCFCVDNHWFMCFSSNFVRGAVFVVVEASAANLNLKETVDSIHVKAAVDHILNHKRCCGCIDRRRRTHTLACVSQANTSSATHSSTWVFLLHLLFGKTLGLTNLQRLSHAEFHVLCGSRP